MGYGTEEAKLCKIGLMKQRIGVLDVLRGFAAIFVVLFHYTIQYDNIFKIDIFNDSIFSWGHFGVQLFFMISGFVIFMTIEKVNSTSEFFYKRIIRLYPTYWICLIFTFTIISLFGPVELLRSTKEFIVGFTMLQDFFKIRPIDGAYWSLQPELLFYAFIVFYNKFNDKIKKYIDIFWILLMIINVYYSLKYVNVLINLRYGVYFLTGMKFYSLYKDKDKLYNYFIIATCIVVSLLVSSSVKETIFFILFSYIFYLLIQEKLSFINNVLFRFIGKISYSLYLIHQFIGYSIIYHLYNIGCKSPLILILIPLFLSLTIASFITIVIEQPLIGYLKKIKVVKLQFYKKI